MNRTLLFNFYESLYKGNVLRKLDKKTRSNILKFLEVNEYKKFSQNNQPEDKDTIIENFYYKLLPSLLKNNSSNYKKILIDNIKVSLINIKDNLQYTTLTNFLPDELNKHKSFYLKESLSIEDIFKKENYYVSNFDVIDYGDLMNHFAVFIFNFIKKYITDEKVMIKLLSLSLDLRFISTILTNNDELNLNLRTLNSLPNSTLKENNVWLYLLYRKLDDFSHMPNFSQEIIKMVEDSEEIKKMINFDYKLIFKLIESKVSDYNKVNNIHFKQYLETSLYDSFYYINKSKTIDKRYILFLSNDRYEMDQTIQSLKISCNNNKISNNTKLFIQGLLSFELSLLSLPKSKDEFLYIEDIKDFCNLNNSFKFAIKSILNFSETSHSQLTNKEIEKININDIFRSIELLSKAILDINSFIFKSFKILNKNDFNLGIKDVLTLLREDPKLQRYKYNIDYIDNIRSIRNNNEHSEDFSFYKDRLSKEYKEEIYDLLVFYFWLLEIFIHYSVSEIDHKYANFSPSQKLNFKNCMEELSNDNLKLSFFKAYHILIRYYEHHIPINDTFL